MADHLETIATAALVLLCWWLCHVNAMQPRRALGRAIATCYGLLATVIGLGLLAHLGGEVVPVARLRAAEHLLLAAVLALVAARREFIERK